MEDSMKSKKIRLVLLLLSLVFCAVFLGCPDGSMNGDLNGNGNGDINGNNNISDIDGIWISTTPVDGTNYIKIFAINGFFVEFMASSQTATTWIEIVRGTYPKGAKSPVTMTITEVNTIMFDSDDEWYTWDELDPIFQSFVGAETQVVNISNDQFAANDVTFVRQNNEISNTISDIDGIWISTTTVEGSSYIKIFAINGIFIEFMAPSETATTWIEVVRGTYPKGAKSPVSMTITEVNTIMFSSGDEWYTWDELEPTFQTFVGAETQVVNISNDQFVGNGITFVRQN